MFFIIALEQLAQEICTLKITTYRSIQFSLTSKNQWKSILINVFLFRPQKLSLHLFTILKGKFCGKKNQWNYYWVILLRQFLIHDIFFQISNIVTENFYCIPSKFFFFFCFKILDVFPLCAWGSFLHMCRSCLSLVVIINKGFQI